MYLALDLGSTWGWAVSDGTRVVASGFHKGKGGMGDKVLSFFYELEALHRTFEFSAVFYEDVKRHLGVQAAHYYGAFLGQLSAFCTMRGVVQVPVGVTTIKKGVTGNGKATKEDMIEFASTLLEAPIADHNQADAICLAWYATIGEESVEFQNTEAKVRKPR